MLHIIAYTDGSCDLRSRTGGWGVYSYFVTASGCKVEMEDYGGYRGATSSGEAEVLAVLRLLQTVPDGSTVEVMCDNEYCTKSLVGKSGERLYERATGYMKGWNIRAGTKKSGEPLKNAKLWRHVDVELARLFSTGGTLTVYWVRGHSGDEGNDRADKLATLGRRSLIRSDKS